MSLRATGEGHLSSFVFRRGVTDKDNHIIIETSSPVSRQLEVKEHAGYELARFRKTLVDIGALDPFAEYVVGELGERFTLRELGSLTERAQEELKSPHGWEQSSKNMYSLARSRYKLTVPEDAEASEIMIFPSSENESQGIEDLRLVRFTHDDGSIRYYGTYTACNGAVMFPTLLETSEFKSIEMETMCGRFAKNQDMALFPRKVDGKFVMSARIDGENLFILESEDVRVWNHG
ncbi:MAG: glycosidase, partial [Candidatus Latescibacterota bacterium]